MTRSFVIVYPNGGREIAMTGIGRRIGVPLERFTSNGRFLIGAIAALLGALAGVLRLM